ncbi:peptidylprolyl isomerase [Winogradskyella jejuensis]|uniref:peptidylprolyl isomerase n=1 Tax=Winogradskyella jejuensis TaxID=1089305 RepID=A0A1M5SCA2_9FLAO|nr:peptidylprolyl isomerase [Winogradskyella jejuensis]SHH36146.1 Peptidyl-prolyl cis-trans isomerase (rotamase)-cyclophilin family [Winogradskyella jejuensis]
MIKKFFMPIATLMLLLTVSCKVQHPDLEDGLYAEIITSKGTMIAKLHYDKVPVTVANFVALAEGSHPLAEEKYQGKPFYDSVTFHRVMDKFMIQGGDPTGTGRGTPGYRFAADFDASLKHDKGGILSMANSGGINTNGSQFFITEVPYPSLDAFDSEGNMKPCDQPRVSCHSVFGELVQGIEVQDSISNVEVIDPRSRNHKPVEDVFITKVNIIRKGREAKKFDAPKIFEEQMPEVEENIKEQMAETRRKAEEKKLAAEEKKAEVAAEFKPTLDEYTAKAKTLASGLKVHYITKGNGVKPKTGQTAMINYQGYFTDGKLLDSNLKDVEEKFGMLNPMKVQRNMYAPSPMKVSPDAPLFAGFKEAIASMRVGDKAFFYFPSHLAYGESGRPPVVQPNTDLAFIIEMVDIQK